MSIHIDEAGWIVLIQIRSSGGSMSKFSDIAVLLAFVVCVSVTLYLFVSLFCLLEIFLIASGILCILWGGYKLYDQVHLFKSKRAYREINLKNARRRLRSPREY